MARVTKLRANGVVRTIDVDGDRTLLSVLRDDLGLTGAKYGCGEGQCGACTVLVDGQAVRSCITPVSTVGDADVTTVEGLEKGGRLTPIQQAFLDVQQMQCGYCTPGMIMSAVGLLQANPRPTRQQIVSAMQGNVCRCGTHKRIVAAIERAAKGGAR